MRRNIGRRLTNKYFRAQENSIGSTERRRVNSRMSYTCIRGYCYDITVVNARAPTTVKRYYKGVGFIMKYNWWIP
jgi:hypothetical protein